MMADYFDDSIRVLDGNKALFFSSAGSCFVILDRGHSTLFGIYRCSLVLTFSAGRRLPLENMQKKPTPET